MFSKYCHQKHSKVAPEVTHKTDWKSINVDKIHAQFGQWCPYIWLLVFLACLRWVQFAFSTLKFALIIGDPAFACIDSVSSFHYISFIA